jgi:hypothetical protein
MVQQEDTKGKMIAYTCILRLKYYLQAFIMALASSIITQEGEKCGMLSRT